MDLINKDFEKLLDNTFLTENVSLFLYSLIRCCLPTNVLEIGAGYSTLFLAKALNDSVDYLHSLNFCEKDTYWTTKYKPILNIIENEQSEDDKLLNIQNTLIKLKLDKFVKIHNQNGNTFNNNEKYDFIWIDYGSAQNYWPIFEHYKNLLMEGGIIVMHSTLTNLWGRLFLTELKLEISKGLYSDLELITFLEPHKLNQNSFTVIKKTTKDPIYTINN